jgi:hypothetical protein
MTITESDRLDMHQALRTALGDTVGDIVMEHLPPTGWGDVARKSDIDYLAQLMETRFGYLESRLTGIVAAMWAMGSVMMTGFIGIFALIATKL